MSGCLVACSRTFSLFFIVRAVSKILEAEYDRLGFKLDVEPISSAVPIEETKLTFTEEESVDETVTAVKSSSKRRTTVGGSKKRARRASEDETAIAAVTPSGKSSGKTTAPATEPVKRSEPLGQ